MKRMPYLDNIRSITILLVVIYHVFYLFNNLGIPGGIGVLTPSLWPDAFLTFVYPWFMVLLFVISGMCSSFELKHNPNLKTFIKHRTIKLLVPSTLGLMVFQWITGYFNIRIGGGLGTIPGFLLYFICALSGTGPLWFIQVLWLDDMLLALLAKLRWNRPIRIQKVNLFILLLPAAGLWASSFVFNLPVLTMYRFGIYTYSFLIGYFLMSGQAVMESCKTYAARLVPAAIFMGIVYVWMYLGQDYTNRKILTSFFTNVYAWLGVLAMLGGFGRWLNFTSPVLRWLHYSSWGIYIFHYPCLLIAGYYLSRTALPAALVYLITQLCGFGGSLLLYALISRIPILRLLVLGISKHNHA